MPLRSGLCAGFFGFSTPALTCYVIMLHGHRHAGIGLGLSVPLKRNCNVTAYKGILYNCVPPTLTTWRRSTYRCDAQVSSYFWLYRLLGIQFKCVQ